MADRYVDEDREFARLADEVARKTGGVPLEQGEALGPKRAGTGSGP